MKIVASAVIILFSLTIYSTMSYSQQSSEDMISECVKQVITTKKYRERVCTTVGARAPGPDVGGGTKRAKNRACITATEGYSIIGAPQVTEKTCYGGRCAHDPVELTSGGEGITREACVVVRAWSEGKSFGGGGFGQYELCATVEQPFTADSVLEILERCKQQANKQ